MNAIKNATNDFGMSYQQLGEILGLSESSLRSAASTGRISKQVEKSIEMYRKILELEKELKKVNDIRVTLKSWLL